MEFLCVREKSKKFESFKSLGSLGGFVCFLWKRKESYELNVGMGQPSWLVFDWYFFGCCLMGI